MQEEEFLAFLNTAPNKGGTTFSIKSHNVSKQARAILEDSPYKMLAKQHINGNIIKAYKNNALFKAKLDEVMEDLGITVVA